MMEKVKIVICIALSLVLLLSACGAKEKETPAETDNSVIVQGTPAAAQENSTDEDQEEALVLSSFAQDLLFPPADHPPLGETYIYDGGYGSGMTEYGIARMEAVDQDYYLFWDYMKKHPDSPLQDHLAGMFNGDEDICWALIFQLDEPENQALLDELAAIGMQSDYRIEKGVGTKAYLEKCLPEIVEKLNALSDKVKSGSATDEEKELIERYDPRNPEVAWEFGRIYVEVDIKTPWYSLGEGWSEADMQGDIEHCRELFYKLIGYEDVIGFGYGV